MTDGDYLWCAVNLLLDEEEETALLCPDCRAEALRDRCPVCGRTRGRTIREENPAFDWARYRAMRDCAVPEKEKKTAPGGEEEAKGP